MSKEPLTTDESVVTSAEADVIIDVKSSITVGLALKKSAELGPSAHDVAAFINTVRELTGEDCALDVRVQVGPAPEAGRNSDGTAIVGFSVTPQTDGYYEEEDHGRKPLN